MTPSQLKHAESLVSMLDSLNLPNGAAVLRELLVERADLLGAWRDYLANKPPNGIHPTYAQSVAQADAERRAAAIAKASPVPSDLNQSRNQ